MSNRDRFIVLVRSDLFERAYGVYRSFKAALEDAKGWNGIVLPLEYHVDAQRPWVAKARGNPTTNGEEPKNPDRSGHLAWNLDDLVITPAPKDKN
jgi:hypothetical protein